MAADPRSTRRAAVKWPVPKGPGRAVLWAPVGDVRVHARNGVGVLTLIQPLPNTED